MIEIMIVGLLLGALAAALVLPDRHTRGRLGADAGDCAWSDELERRYLSERRNLVPK
jgi:hypothetical protein